jgi:hypothetical protein
MVSTEAVIATAEEFNEAEVAEDLELLADFGADVAIGRMEFGKGVNVSIDIGKGEFGLFQGLNDLENIQRPAAFFYFQFFERP